jgi:hypothetical protein
MASGTVIRKTGEMVFVILLGGAFFFIIIGVFGLKWAIGGLLVFALDAVVICRKLPAGA